ncbi:MAG: hypothetical protein H7A35_15195 [Planctomycetales bacterium]|nr:MAG: hypothetical protein H7A35_15195 [Planctomycetales bacterium]
MHQALEASALELGMNDPCTSMKLQESEMKHLTIRIATVAVLVLSGFSLSCYFPQQDPPVKPLPVELASFNGKLKANYPPSPGLRLPDFTGMDASSREVLTQDSLQGKWTLLNFTASW